MKTARTSSGWTMQGICIQWAVDHGDMSDKEFRIFSKILRHSFGFSKRWCLLKYTDFGSNKASVSKSLNNLRDKGIISYSKTNNPDTGHRGMNKYRILKPKAYVDNFIFKTKDSKNIENNSKKIEEIEEEMPW